MDSIDWRKKPDKLKAEMAQTGSSRYLRRKMGDYVEEMIREAEARGDFSNLPGTGKPLKLEESDYVAGDKSMAYRILKNNGFSPPEIELAKEIRSERGRAEAKLTKITHQGQRLRARRVPPFASEKQAFNLAVKNVEEDYERTLRQLNSKILTLNLISPPQMHHAPLDVEHLVAQFRRACPLFEA